MFQWLIDLLREIQERSHLEQLGYVVAVVSTIGGLAFGYRGLVRRKYAKMQEAYEELSAKSESYMLRIKDLKAEIGASNRTIEDLRTRVPEFQLENAEKERLEGNETRTIHILRDLYADVGPSISSCCFQLGQYHLAMYVDDATADHLDGEVRLVRISSLLEPEREDVSNLLGEIEAVRADSISRTGDQQTADAHWDMALEYVGGGPAGRGMTLIETLRGRARALHEEGRFNFSLIFFRRAAILAAEHFGPDHPETLSTRHNLAVLYATTGRYAEAEPLLKEDLAKREQKLGPDHPGTLSTRHNLAALYRTTSRYAEAEPLLKEVIAEQEQKLGPDHPDTLDTRTDLAALYVRTRQYAEAESLLREVLGKQQQKLGADHPNTQMTQALLNQLSGLGATSLG